MNERLAAPFPVAGSLLRQHSSVSQGSSLWLDIKQPISRFRRQRLFLRRSLNATQVLSQLTSDPR